MANARTANNRKKDAASHALDKWAVFAFGVVFVLLLLILAVFFRDPSAFQLLVFRTILALAAAGVAAFIPGLLEIDLSWVRAGGALAVLVLVYKFSPAELVVARAPPEVPAIVVTYRICSGEYERACLPHDIYQYCGFDVKQWAQARCKDFKLTRLDVRDGNKCGYDLHQVICIGPK